MRADECEFHRFFIKRLVERADISSYVNTPVSFENTAKRVIVQRGVERVVPEQRDPLFKTQFDFCRYFSVLLCEAAMEKDFHKRLR